MSKKIRKGEVVLAKDLTEDYWGAEIEIEHGTGIKSIMVLKKHQAMYANAIIDLYPEGGPVGFYRCVMAKTKVTILTPPSAHHPEKPTEMGTIIQTEGDPSATCVVDYYGDILSLLNANHVTWDSVKSHADTQGSKILVSKPTASYDDGLTDIETRDDWDPSKEELYRTRQWEDVDGDIWSFRDGSWHFSGLGEGRWLDIGVDVPWDYTPLRLIPKDEEIS